MYDDHHINLVADDSAGQLRLSGWSGAHLRKLAQGDGFVAVLPVETLDVDVVPARMVDNLTRLAEALNLLRPRWRVEGIPEGMKIDGGLEARHFLGDSAAIGLVTRLGVVDVVPPQWLHHFPGRQRVMATQRATCGETSSPRNPAGSPAGNVGSNRLVRRFPHVGGRSRTVMLEPTEIGPVRAAVQRYRAAQARREAKG